MHRFYAQSFQEHQGVLTPEDHRHATRVLRMRPGDPCELIWDGCRYQAVLGEDGMVETVSLLPSTEPALKITLFQGLPKADKMDWIVQKAVEIGVSEIVPVLMRRCIVQMDKHDAEKKQARWQKIAREAGKQCGRCIIPQVSLPVFLEELPSMTSSTDACIVPWEECTSIGPLAFRKTHPSIRSLGLLIGPEGGIEAEEIRLLDGRFQPLTLGPRILRTETAGLAAASAMMALYGEME